MSWAIERSARFRLRAGKLNSEWFCGLPPHRQALAEQAGGGGLASAGRHAKTSAMTGKIIVIIALAAVVAILFAGLITMWIGGETANKWSNRLMRYRVLAQAIAIAIVLLVLYVSSRH
jgi:hypothetical protein